MSNYRLVDVEVVADSPAAAAGLQHEDLLVEAAGVALRAVEDLQRLMTEETIGREIELTIVRRGDDRRVLITAQELAGRSLTRDCDTRP